MIERVVAKIRAITASFLSENTLPFSLAEALLNYAQRVSEDKQALEKTTIPEQVPPISTHMALPNISKKN